MSKLFDIALSASEKGAKQALKYFDKGIGVKYKEDKTPVTIADKETEEIIRRIILSLDPEAKFVGEEGGGSTEQDSFWIIDPIDGTRNYSRGIPVWKILIGYIKNGEPIFGMSYDPFTKKPLWAEKNKGAFLGKEKLKVSKVNSLDKAFLFYGNPRYFKNKDKLFDLIIKSEAARSSDVGNFLLATGKIDALIDPYGRAWDVAPIKVIIEEAGGKVTNLEGNKWSFDDVGCIASNGLFHDDVVKILNK